MSQSFPDPTDAVRRSYAARSEEYTARFGSMSSTHAEDQEVVRAWAAHLAGPVLDVGCGPGHWTAHLHGLGLDVAGLDLVPEFVVRARASHPEAEYREGTMLDLGVPDGGLAGILAWYSIIHTPPERLSAVLQEFRRALAPEGRLLIAFVEGPATAAFPHAVTTAWAWPIDELSRRLALAGLAETGRWARAEEGRRPHAALEAVVADPWD